LVYKSAHMGLSLFLVTASAEALVSSRGVRASGASAGAPEWPSVRLSDGALHPRIGFGTYKVGYVPPSASSAASGAEAAGGDAANAEAIVGAALGVGYRFLDCAQYYGNEANVGRAVSASGVPRADLYLASKVWTDAIYAGPEAVRREIERSLVDLQTEYLDLYLVHWPVPGYHVEAYLEVQRAQAEGLIRSIGVSNYAVEDVEELLSDPRVTSRPVVNQIELNPFLYRPETLAYMARCGIQVQAYRALRDGKAFDDPTVARIATEHGRSSAQVLGRWCLGKGAIYMPKSTNPQRMAENARVFDFALTPANVADLDGLTTPRAIQQFKALYEKCVVRDTPLSPDDERIKRDITAG